MRRDVKMSCAPWECAIHFVGIFKTPAVPSCTNHNECAPGLIAKDHTFTHYTFIGLYEHVITVKNSSSVAFK